MPKTKTSWKKGIPAKGQIKPGEVRNPLGAGAPKAVEKRAIKNAFALLAEVTAPKSAIKSELVQELLIKNGLEATNENVIAATLMYKAIYEQDIKAIKEYFDRLYGKSTKKEEKKIAKLVVFANATGAGVDLTNDIME